MLLISKHRRARAKKVRVLKQKEKGLERKLLYSSYQLPLKVKNQYAKILLNYKSVPTIIYFLDFVRSLPGVLLFDYCCVNDCETMDKL